jgi:uncharacterized C2H2 Zn-finger protein
MKELTITVYCDACWQTTETKVPSVQMLNVSMSGNARPVPVKELEFCAEHAPMALALMAIYEAAALSDEPPAVVRPLKAVSEADRTSTECPICERVYSARNTAVAHIMSVHRPGEPLYPADLKCERCGKPCASAQGYASHLHAHGIDVIARAAEPVLARERMRRERASG